jgi:6-phosphogluconolactonase
MIDRNRLRKILFGAAAVLLSSCGGGGNSPPAPPTYSVGGTISGLRSSGLVLQNNGGGNLSVPATATTFHFPGSVTSGTAYDVTVAASPSGPPAQTCTVQNGSGTVTNSSPMVSVTCATVANELLLGIDATGNIHGYPIDPDTGAPRPDTIGLAADAVAIATDPSGGHIYTASGSSSNISLFTVTDSGGLQPALGSPFAVPSAPNGLVIDASGHYLYAASAPGFFGYTIAPSTGALTPIAGGPFLLPYLSVPLNQQPPPLACTAGCAASDSALFGGIFYNSGPSWELFGFQIAPGSGALQSSYLSSIQTADDPSVSSVLIDPSGKFLYVAEVEVGLREYVIDASSGSVTQSGLISTVDSNGADYYALASDPAGKHLYSYLTGMLGTVLEQFDIDPATGLVTTIPGVITLPNLGSVPVTTVDRAGKFLFVVAGAQAYVFSIDAGSGALTQVSGSPFTLSTSLTTLTTAVIP